MRAIIVDDEAIMLRRFTRVSEGIKDLCLVGQFDSAEDALQYAEKNPVELAFLDVDMPIMNGLELARRLRKMRSDMLIVFVTAYDEYIWDSNQIGGDDYIVKPFSREVLEKSMDRIRLLAKRQEKILYVHTFGRFFVSRDGKPIRLTGKAKEILALLVVYRGKEVSNETIFNTLWEGREYSNASMIVYFNALRRLKQALTQAGIRSLLISNTHGQLVNTDLFDCDYYAWMDGHAGIRDRFDGEFLSEYSWGESFLAQLTVHQ